MTVTQGSVTQRRETLLKAKAVSGKLEVCSKEHEEPSMIRDFMYKAEIKF